MFFGFAKYFLVSLVFVSLLFIIKAANAVDGFKDMKTHWASVYAQELKANCQIGGYKDDNGNDLNEFRPELLITRAELIKMLVQCKNGELSNPGDSFIDVDPNQWYAPVIALAKKAGWITGYADGTFLPNNAVTRAEAMKIILLSKFPDTDITAGGNYFDDVSQGDWFYQYVSFAKSKGYIGYIKGKLFEPYKELTRGEAASIIAKVYLY